MGEHLPCKQGVKSSILFISITLHHEGFFHQRSMTFDVYLDNQIVKDISGQIEKSTRRMPWHMAPTKDGQAPIAAGSPKDIDPWVSEWRNPAGEEPVILPPIHNGRRGYPAN